MNSLQVILEKTLGPAILSDRILTLYELTGQALDMVDEEPSPSQDTFYFARRLEFHPSIRKKFSSVLPMKTVNVMN